MGRDIGQKERYKAKYIRNTFTKYHFNKEYLPYAFALLSDKNEYQKEYPNEMPCRFNELRKEIANTYFSGNNQYTFNDLMKITKFKGSISSPDGSETGRKNHSEWGFSDGSSCDGGGGDG